MSRHNDTSHILKVGRCLIFHLASKLYSWPAQELMRKSRLSGLMRKKENGAQQLVIVPKRFALLDWAQPNPAKPRKKAKNKLYRVRERKRFQTSFVLRIVHNVITHQPTPVDQVNTSPSRSCRESKISQPRDYILSYSPYHCIKYSCLRPTVSTCSCVYHLWCERSHFISVVSFPSWNFLA